MTSLTLFYDGRCPLCVAEMRRLARADNARRLAFEDIHQHGFHERFPNIDATAARRTLHGQTGDGQLLLGLDASCHAWKAVGQRQWTQLLRWPLIKPLADAAYTLLARHRYRLSRWLDKSTACDGHCALPDSTPLDPSPLNQDPDR